MQRVGEYLQESELEFNASFIVGGQIDGEPSRPFRIYAEGNFIEAGVDTPYLQTGVLVSFDSTMRSNLSVGMPIDLICDERDSLVVTQRRRFDERDEYFTALSRSWGEGALKVFRELPELRW